MRFDIIYLPERVAASLGDEFPLCGIRQARISPERIAYSSPRARVYG